jgi:Protein of unknown function (DUF3431)
MKTHLIISSYKKDVYWCQKLLEKGLVDEVFIYEHSDTKRPDLPPLCHYENTKNKSCEASAYLKYICDHYNQLPDKIILVHDEEYSWHHTGSIVDIVERHTSCDAEYTNINHYRWGIDVHPFLPDGDYYKYYTEFLEPYYGPVESYGNFHNGHLGCAQFILKPAAILRNPLKFYQDLYNYSVSDNVKDGHNSGGFEYFMEYTWHLIFGLIEKCTATTSP